MQSILIETRLEQEYYTAIKNNNLVKALVILKYIFKKNPQNTFARDNINLISKDELAKQMLILKNKTTNNFWNSDIQDFLSFSSYGLLDLWNWVLDIFDWLLDIANFSMFLWELVDFFDWF